VRFRRLHAHGFGVLRGREIELPPETALVFGPNESGKSTFRDALETILYGFDPADRDAHPLVLWDDGAGGDLKLEAELERDAGGTLRVERELRARGLLRLAEAGKSFEAERRRNVPLDCVSHLARALYRAVYSLELGQLVALEASVQADVDELLLPQAAAIPLRPLNELRAELKAEQNALWRAHRRGHSEARRLGDEISALRREAETAAVQERALRAARSEQARLAEALAQLEARRRELDRIEAEAPFLGELFQLRLRRAALGDPIDLAPLAGLPLADPADLLREIAELEEASREPRARRAREPETLTEREAALLAAEPELRAALAALPEHSFGLERREERLERARTARETARRELAAVLAHPPGEKELDAARALPLEALRAAHSEWASAWQRHTRLASSRASRGWLALSASGIAASLLALLLEPWLAGAARAIAIGSLAVGLLALLVAWLAPRRQPPPSPAFRELLAGLAPAPALLASPAELLRRVERIERTQGLLAEARAADLSLAALERALDAREAGWAALCRRFGLDDAGDGEACCARLADARERVLAREAQVARDAEERRRAQERLDEILPQLERKREHLRRVEAVARASEPEAPLAAAYARLRERREEEEFVQRRERELGQDPRYARLAGDPRASIEREAGGAEWSAAATAARERERAALAQRLADANLRLGEIRSRLGEDPGGRQARIEDRIREAEEQLADAKRSRDRLALLEAIVARAEQDFRDQHQPDVLRRASVYLERVTKGRWRRLDYEAGAAGGLFVTGGEREERVRAQPPLSRGALDQVFLCLRLGLLDHLDAGRERLPLVLDDALLRMDDERREQVYELLAEISRRRQIVLLTCQEWIAAEAERALKLRRIPISG
jgi:uncharacterized protein YhaN